MSDPKSIDDMTVAELEEVAAANSIDLAGASNKADKLELVRAGLDAVQSDADNAGGHKFAGDGDTPAETRLDSHIGAPSTTAPGDGPADTTDPTEQATNVPPDVAAAALAGHQTANGHVPVKQPTRRRPKAAEQRIEQYDRVRPDGKVVTIEHNLDTGATTAIAVRDGDA